MTDLITRIEAAKEPSIELFLAAAIAMHMKDKKPVAWWENFAAKLDAQAWTSAAEMLVPDKCLWRLKHNTMNRKDSWANAYVRFHLIGNEPEHLGCGRHPSLALLAAILRAERKDDE